MTDQAVHSAARLPLGEVSDPPVRWRDRGDAMGQPPRPSASPPGWIPTTEAVAGVL